MMEVIRSPPPPHFLFQFTPKSPLFSGSTAFKFRISSSNCSRRNLKISAGHFLRKTTRRNFLRKKLAQDTPTMLVLPSNFDSQPPRKLGDSFSDSRNNNSYHYEEKEEVTGFVEKTLGGGGESQRDKLGSWVDQYNKDVQLWGFGSGTIFTILLDSNGNVKQVKVDEDEIHKREENHHHHHLDLDSNNKVVLAKNLARKMELGNNNVIPRNSSVAKFIIVNSGTPSFVGTISRDLPHLIPPPPKLNVGWGVMVLFGFVVVWAVKCLAKREEVQYTTQLEKEMMIRKMKLRKQKEKTVVVEEEDSLSESDDDDDFSRRRRRPKLNKQEVLDIIRRTTESSGSSTTSILQEDRSNNILHSSDHRTQEIGGGMARKGRGSEASEPAAIMEGYEQSYTFPSGISGGNKPIPVTQLLPKADDAADSKFETSGASNLNISYDMQQDVTDRKGRRFHITGSTETAPPIINTALYDDATPIQRKPRIIRSVEEAREYLSNNIRAVKRCETDLQNPSSQESEMMVLPGDSGEGSSIDHSFVMANQFDSFAETSKLAAADASISRGLTAQTLETTVSSEGSDLVNTMAQSGVNSGSCASGESSGKTENWIQENFGVVKPVVEKIAAGFRNNYMSAKEKVTTNSSSVVTEMSQLQFPEDESEFEWMNDNRLQEIVFQVRENELMGRDPFYSMDTEDKCAFFEGLENKVVKENEKLLHLHEYLHSNIENLYYGADGISLHDPPEKIVPRWKGTTAIEKDPEFLRSYWEERKAFVDEKALTGIYPVEERTVQEEEEEESREEDSSSAEIKLKKNSSANKKGKTVVIESSDGFVKAGKKSGKEYWQHTKKWSRGFLESYNAETDPEVKSEMKEIGKDLDRWITDKEIEEAADLINKLPERNKKFIEKKLDKVKREMELFGPQAVVSKYREYAEADEEDYLWWLDLPHVLCIELYITEDGEQKVGFYSLEMAPDLELDPKPHHVIAFEDPRDCKDLCYIIQAHMEMLGNGGHAFIVSRPPKDAYREAKTNGGFGVTVIRKGELQQLNVDKTLEEVEEEITELGSKMYHDKIMKERSVDISGLMKGVFSGLSTGKPKRRRRSR